MKILRPPFMIFLATDNKNFCLHLSRSKIKEKSIWEFYFYALGNIMLEGKFDLRLFAIGVLRFNTGERATTVR